MDLKMNTADAVLEVEDAVAANPDLDLIAVTRDIATLFHRATRATGE